MDIQEKFKYAGFWPRLLAHNIDLIPILGLFYVSSLLPDFTYDIFMLGGIYVLYHTLFELSDWHATPGKRWAKIKVLPVNDEKNITGRVLLRNVSKIFSLLLFFGGFIMIFFDRKKRALHDYIGGTLVLFGED